MARVQDTRTKKNRIDKKDCYKYTEGIVKKSILFPSPTMKQTEPWIRKYSPKRLEGIVGQDSSLSQIREHIKTFNKHKRPLFLYGPPGTGKTVTAYALAEEFDLELIEVNASDTRNKDAINTLLGSAMHQQSLFFKGKLILIDEADGLSGRSDRGGIPALVALVKESVYPIIITANESTRKLKPLKKLSKSIEFALLKPSTTVSVLTNIAKKEGVKFDDMALESIAHRSGGDLRAAINDLQTLSGGERLTMEDLEALGEREKKEEIQNALLRIFKTTSANVALPAFDNVDENVDKIFLWIDENLSKEYKRPEDLAQAYDALAEADRFFGRIRRWQYYRFYVYIYNLLSAGIALAKEKRYEGKQTFKESSRILSIWITKQKYAKRRAIAEKLAEKTHTSKRCAEREVMILKPLLRQRSGMGLAVAEELELDSDEVGWLRR